MVFSVKLIIFYRTSLATHTHTKKKKKKERIVLQGQYLSLAVTHSVAP